MKSISKHLFICSGENWVRSPYVKMGYCGDVNTLKEWLKILFFEYDEEQLNNYSKGKSEKDLIDYIYMVKGKRLQKIKGN